MKTLLLVMLLQAQVAYYGGRSYTPENYPQAVWHTDAMCMNIKAQWRAQGWRPPGEFQPKQQVAYDTMQVLVRCVNGVCYYETVRVERPSQQVVLHEPVVASTTVVADAYTPKEVLDRVISMLYLKPGMVFVDAGCGDGRVLKAVALANPDVTCIGYEIDKQVANLAHRNVAEKYDNVVVYHGDALIQSYEGVDAVYMYQHEDVVAELVEKLPPGTLIISYGHEIPGVANTTHHVGRHRVYIGTSRTWM